MLSGGANKRKLKAVAKKNMKKLNQSKGHEQHNEDHIKRTRKSETLRATLELCKKYLNEKHEPILEKVHALDMYITCE